MTNQQDLSESFIIFLDKIGMADLPKVGGKNASLGEMIRNLANKNIKVPHGFAVTVEAFDAFIEENQLRDKIEKALADVDVSDIVSLRKTGSEIRKQISNGRFPVSVEKAILKSYYRLSELYGQDATDIAVRCRPAIHLPQYTGRGNAAHRHPQLLCLPVYRQGHFIPLLQGV